MKPLYKILALTIFGIMFPSMAHAACTSPAGVEGDMIYNTDHHVATFCNGTNWIAFGGGGSSQWTTTGSDIYYNTGKVGIGVTTPTAALTIMGTGSGSAPATSGSTDPTTNLRIERGSVTVDIGTIDNGTSYIQNRLFSNQASNYNLSLQPNGGNVGIGTTNPTSKLTVAGQVDAQAFLYSSDLRLKENITPLHDVLLKMDKIKGVTFTFINDEKKQVHLGVVAQEIEEVYPQAVTTDSNGFKKVDYPALVPVLIEAVKELKKQNNELRTRVENLEAKE